MRLKSDVTQQIGVTVDLTVDRIVLSTADAVIGSWRLGDIGVRGEDDGIHFRIEGEEAVIRTDDDAGLALAIGLQSASPRLRRQMAARRR
jgi:hypothetical protein